MYVLSARRDAVCCRQRPTRDGTIPTEVRPRQSRLPRGSTGTEPRPHPGTSRSRRAAVYGAAGREVFSARRIVASFASRGKPIRGAGARPLRRVTRFRSTLANTLHLTRRSRAARAIINSRHDPGPGQQRTHPSGSRALGVLDLGRTSNERLAAERTIAGSRGGERRVYDRIVSPVSRDFGNHRAHSGYSYMMGWRVQSEILTRQKSHVDIASGWLR